jgi:hypothetical protein|tara:strand:+ start:38 stop:295 length:258 start_codon:yes stop_codon:yes gene_type:complete
MNYTLEEILEAWDSSYGENMAVEYPGFFEKLIKKEETQDHDFMWMRSPQQALDEIAFLIHMEAPLKEQDRWLTACIDLDLVEDNK